MYCVTNQPNNVIENLIKTKYRERCKLNESPLLQTQFKEFDGIRKPCISIDDYYERFIYYTQCDKSVLLASWCYLDKILHMHSDLYITELNIHRLFSQAFNTALKIWDDNDYITVNKFCEIAGYGENEYIRLETCFMKLLNYECLLDMSTQLVLKNLEILHKNTGFIFDS